MRKVQILIILFLLVALGKSFAQQNANEKWNQIIGCWVYHSDNSFELIHIHSVDSVVIYYFVDREKEIGEPDSTMQYYFYTSRGFIHQSDSPNQFSIQTKSFRFDYIFDGNKLIEYGKSGLERELIKADNYLDL